jgi:hypothetical protein
MSPALKYEYFEKIKERYRKAKKKEKKLILDEFCTVCGYERKYAIKKLSGKKIKTYKSKNKPGPKPKYDNKIIPILQKLWLATDQICSKRLVAAIPQWLPFYEKEYGSLPESIKKQLLAITPSTIDRKLKPVRVKLKRKGLCGTKPGSLLKNHIPIRTDNWDIKKPGFFEADTVAHSGNSLLGDFAWSLTMTDIFSHWTENRATWGKGSEGVKKQIQNVETSLFFTILGFDCDNGSEFLNWALWRYFVDDRKTQPVQFTRSRAYKKNDNAHVEQKNWTHVRQLLGYDRFDNPDVVELMNDLYSNEWSQYQNYFIPTMKLEKKERINSKNKKYHEKNPKTPYQRLIESEHVSEQAKEKLKAQHKTLNPFALKRVIEKKLKIILNIATVSSNMSQP